MHSSPIVSKEGRYGGTFAHELLAVEYAGWISPGFRIKVNQTFIDYRNGKLQPALNPANVSRLQLTELAMQAEQERSTYRMAARAASARKPERVAPCAFA